MTEKPQKVSDFSNPDDACDYLDDHGFLPRPGESRQDFLDRAQKCYFEGKGMDVSGDPLLKGAVSIPQEILAEGAERTRKCYGLSALYVPGFFLNHGFGFLWGGCTASDDDGNAAFLLRDSFAKRKRWFIYDRAELLAHEQCHAARTPVMDQAYEEFFAYQTSAVAFRRYLGNCFRSQADTIICMAGFGLLLIAEALVALRLLPDQLLWIFLAAALVYPAFALIRNQLSRNRFFRAENNLKGAGLAQTRPILFRATREEIDRLADAQEEDVAALLQELQAKELRWQISLRKFGKNQTQK